MHIETGINDISFVKTFTPTTSHTILGSVKANKGTTKQGEIVFSFYTTSILLPPNSDPDGSGPQVPNTTNEGTSIEFWTYQRTSSNNINYTTTYQKSMVIEKDGKVGIGYDAPGAKLAVNGKVTIGSNAFPEITNEQGTAYKLAVEGGIISQEVTVEMNIGNWPDYVFETTYDLTSLPTLKKYLTLYKRLPNTPSATDIEKNGVELKSITIAQQQNIEEIFLHLIQLNERISQLEKDNHTLTSQLNNLSNEK